MLLNIQRASKAQKVVRLREKSQNNTMNQHYRYWLALHPDIRRPIGGVKQMHRLAEALNYLGRDARIIQDNASFHPGWFKSNVLTISHSEFSSCIELSPDRDVIILPETFLPALPKYAPGLPKIIFNQNGAYSFGFSESDGFPDPDEVLKLYAHPDLKHVLCVSRHDERLLKDAFRFGETRVSRLINGIETKLFQPIEVKHRVISYMPRKNSKDAAIVAALLREQRWFQESGWSLHAIKGLPQEQVAELLQKSLVFLAFGHPEGFGLPLAEAAGCGCYLIGYSGLGGSELFQLASRYNAGREIAYGDWLGFLEACKELNGLLHSNQSKLATSILQCSKTIRELYSPQKMISSVQVALERWEAQLT